MIGSTDYLVDIIGINHDDYSDGFGKAPFTFQLHDCYGKTKWRAATQTETVGLAAPCGKHIFLPSWFNCRWKCKMASRM